MESYKIENLSFTYPSSEKRALCDISLTVNRGEFICLCGKSGCGKTTLLRLLKTTLAPFGTTDGKILFEDRVLSDVASDEQATKIGFVLQNIENQIVTDKVWHELAFGLESLGVQTNEIRTRVSEMAEFFGITDWFYKSVSDLSGGEKQLLNLASVMVMRPDVLILDEPTSQLDPIAASEFLKTLEKINRELGTTVILSEHRLEEAFAIADRVVVMDNGIVIADDTPLNVGKTLKKMQHDMVSALPTPMRVADVLSVREGRLWLEDFGKTNTLYPERIPKTENKEMQDTCIEMKDVWFRYEKNTPDVIKGLSLKVNKGEIYAIIGGNGTGKTTTLSLIGGINVPYRGKVTVSGKTAVLPQNPQILFTGKTVQKDLEEIKADKELLSQLIELCELEGVLLRHPYDLSGGESQRVALAKVLLTKPEILLLDEPTKGLDAHFKDKFADILYQLTKNGMTVVMVSHDIEFCAKYADRCSMFFDGGITATESPRKLFAGNTFYTTSANRMAKSVLSDAVLAEDIILACGGAVEDRKRKNEKPIEILQEKSVEQVVKPRKKLSPLRIVLGSGFTLLFAVLTILMICCKIIDTDTYELIASILVICAMLCLLPRGEMGVRVQARKNRLKKRTLASFLAVLIAVPLTVYIGKYYLADRKYYFISLLIIFEILIPFTMAFENRKPQARELVIISALCAIAVSGRLAFYMLPQFKPVMAIVIIAGICFGGEAGFLVGAVTAFVSNFFFGQGPWTVWQMVSFGAVGFLAGILFGKGFLRKTRISLCIFGFLATVIVYGFIANTGSVLMMQATLTKEALVASLVAGLPFDLVHGVSVAFFLWFIAEPMVYKLERIKTKYGLLE